MNNTTLQSQPEAPSGLAVPTGSRPTFRAGDVVNHGPTGETWTLANDEEDSRVSPCGWPRCWAEAADCTLVDAATNEKRIEMLTRWAAKTVEETEGYDHRVSTAKHQLSANVAGVVTAPRAPQHEGR